MATGFDVIGLLLIMVMAMSGLKKGLIDGVMKMVGVYAAIYASMSYNHYGTLILEPLINIPESYKTPAGFVVIFIGVMYSITFISFLLRKLVKTMHLGSLDRIGGITFGAMKAGLILSAVVWALAMVPENMRGTWQQDSKLYPLVEVYADYMVNIFHLEDELAFLESTAGSFMGKSKEKLLEKALNSGGAATLGGINTEAITKVGGTGELAADGESIIPTNDDLSRTMPDLSQNEVLKKAIESLKGPQREIVEQAMNALQTGNASTLLEGAIKSKDSTGASLMDEAMQYMDPSQKAEMSEMIKQMEAEIRNQRSLTE